MNPLVVIQNSSTSNKTTSMNSIEQHNKLNQSSSWLTKTVKWLRADDEQEPFFALVKNVLALALAILLTVTLIGIPVVWRSFEIWDELDEKIPQNLSEKIQQNSADRSPGNSDIYKPSTIPDDWDFPEGVGFTTHDGQTRIFYSKLLFEGKQTECSGLVDIPKAESIREDLNKKSSEGILFNKKKLTGRIEGGTCTAMCVKFISTYFKIKNTCKRNPDYTPQKLLDSLSQIGKKFASSSEKMKVRQAAYNTIEVTGFDIDSTIDYSKNKMQSILNHRSFVINRSSSEIELNYHNEKLISDEVEALPEGTYLLRIIKPDNKEKLEEHGHSLVYIKEEGIGLFYDPNMGVIQLVPQEHSDILSICMLNRLGDFGLNKARFYQIQPNSVSSS